MTGDARRFARYAAGGSLAALVPNVWLLLGGHWSLLSARGSISGFYDVQARALLHGHLAVPPGAVGFEGFRHGGATYIYQGPVPSLLRLPVLIVTHSADGRLTPLSLLLALVVALVAASVLHWRVRTYWSVAPITRLDLALAALVPIAVGGSILLYLAGWPVVYHESEMWGAALTLAALAAAVGLVRHPTARGIAWAALWAALAINTRVAVGLGAVAALLALAAAFALERRDRRVVLGVAGAALLALLSSVAVNEAKFSTPFGIPIRDQVASSIDPNRKAALAANHGTIFGAQFVPTQALAWLRPDALGSTRAFPFIGVPSGPPDVVGNVRFDTLQRSLSATTSMTLLCVLCLVGVVALARSRRRRPLFAVLLGSLAGVAGALSIGYVTTRYLADGLPFLVLGALAGLCALLSLPTARRRRVLFAVAALLALWAIVVNGAAGLVNGRLLTAGSPERDRAAFVRLQDRIDEFLGRRPSGVAHGGVLPKRAGRPGDLFVVGRCDGLYVASALGTWLPVERTPATGLDAVSVAPGARMTALVRLGGRITLLGRRQDGTIALVLRRPGAADSSPALVAAPSGRADITVSAEPLDAGAVAVGVRAGGRQVLSALLPDVPPPATLGPDAIARPAPAPVCHRVAGRAGIPL